MQPCIYLSMRIWICTWRLMRLCQMKSSIWKLAPVHYSLHSVSSISQGLQQHAACTIHQEPLRNLSETKGMQRLKVDMFAFISLMHYMKHWICHNWEICRGLAFSSVTLGDNATGTLSKNRWGECANALRNHRLFCQQRCHMNALLGLFSVQLTWCMIMSLSCEHTFLNIVARRIRYQLSVMG